MMPSCAVSRPLPQPHSAAASTHGPRPDLTHTPLAPSPVSATGCALAMLAPPPPPLPAGGSDACGASGSSTSNSAAGSPVPIAQRMCSGATPGSRPARSAQVWAPGLGLRGFRVQG
jgi:hypothetical protein